MQNQIDLLNSVINSQAIELHILRRQMLEMQQIMQAAAAENESLRKALEPQTTDAAPVDAKAA